MFKKITDAFDRLSDKHPLALVASMLSVLAAALVGPPMLGMQFWPPATMTTDFEAAVKGQPSVMTTVDLYYYGDKTCAERIIWHATSQVTAKLSFDQVKGMAKDDYLTLRKAIHPVIQNLVKKDPSCHAPQDQIFGYNYFYTFHPAPGR